MHKNVRLLSVLFFIVNFCYSQSHLDTIAYSLGQVVNPIYSIDPKLNSYQDLIPLKKALANKQIVALGEATHGAKEFYLAKHRLVKFLIEELSYRVFVLEENFAVCQQINNYILYGQGNPKKLVKNFYVWPWQTEEIIDLLVWMSQYNRSLPTGNKIRFYGFDMQQGYDSFYSLSKFFAEADTDFLSALPDTAYLANKNQRMMYHLDSTTAYKIGKQLQIRKSAYTTKLSVKEWQRACIHATLLQQHTRFLTLYHANQQRDKLKQYRDSCMAMNVKQLVEYEGPESKLILWAHNAHIAKLPFTGYTMSMGTLLQKFYGEQFYSIGFDYNEGSFTYLTQKGFEVYPSKNNPNDTFSGVIAKLKQNYLFVDFRLAKTNDVVKEWLESNLEIHYNFYRNNGILPTFFDGMVYVNQISPVRVIPN